MTLPAPEPRFQNPPEGFLIEGTVLRAYRGQSLDVAVPDGVTEIAANAFSFSELEHLFLPDGLHTIGNLAFEYCNHLRGVRFPKGLRKIGWYAFKGCTDLLAVKLEEGLRFLDAHAFSGCRSIIAVTLPRGLREIGAAAFEGCSSLETVTFGEGLRRIGPWAFYDCGSIHELTLPETLRSVGHNAFDGCGALRRITFPEGFERFGVQTFYRCVSLSELTVPAGVKRLPKELCAGCTSLASVTLPQGLLRIDAEAFYFCKSLRTLLLPSGMEHLAPAALTGLPLTTVIYEGSALTFSACQFSTELTLVAPKIPIGRYPMPQRQNAVVYCAERLYRGEDVDPAFKEGVLRYLKSHRTFFYAHLEKSEALLLLMLRHGFLTPHGIERVLPSAESFSVPTRAALLSYRDAHRPAKTSPALALTFEDPAEVPDGGDVPTIEAAPYWTWKKEADGTLQITGYRGNGSNVKVPSSIGGRAVTSIAPLAFSPMKQTLRAAVRQSRRSRLTTVELPPSVVRIGEKAFVCCSALSSVTVRGEGAEIGFSAFQDCRALSSVSLPEGVLIGPRAFSETGLRTLTVPNHCRGIGAAAFEYCYHLTAVTVGKGLVGLDDLTFRLCHALTELHLPESLVRVGSSALRRCHKNLTIHAPSGSFAERYAAAVGVAFRPEKAE